MMCIRWGFQRSIPSKTTEQPSTVSESHIIPISCMCPPSSHSFQFKSYSPVASLDQSSMVKVGVGLAPRQFSSGAFSSYYQYPASNGRILTTPTTNLDQSQRFVDPFGGTATVSQAAAIGSAYWHSISGSSPSSLAQYLSAETYDVRQETRMLATAAAAALYESRSFDDLAVCSQWPNPCGISDGRFVSGDFSDSFGLASSIGQYHQEGNSPQRSRLKVIVTYNNFHEWNNMRLRAYFETDFNALVSPGGMYGTVRYRDEVATVIHHLIGIPCISNESI